MFSSLAQLLFSVSFLREIRLDENETSRTLTDASLRTRSLNESVSFWEMDIFMKKFAETSPMVSSLSFLSIGLSSSLSIRREVFLSSEIDSFR